jgi:hypothetical protein
MFSISVEAATCKRRTNTKESKIMRGINLQQAFLKNSVLDVTVQRVNAC